MKEILLDTKVITKTRPGPKSRKKERKTFGNIKPNASSPPPPEGMDVTTEDEERQGSITRPTIGAVTDVANLADFSDDDSADSAALARTLASGATKKAKKALSSTSKKARNKEERQNARPPHVLEKGRKQHGI